jgi:serine/threonine protein phosphatase 1
MGFFATLFGKQQRATLPPEGVAVPPGVRIYAVGDIHGCAQQLITLLKALKKDAAGYKGRVVFVGIGDAIDRGPSSSDVVDILQTHLPDAWEKVFLRGNHEQALLDFLKAPRRTAAWMAWGGLQTLESYGVRLYGPTGARPPEELAADLKLAVEARGHAQFYRATCLSHTVGNLLFVHAGVRPGVPLHRQTAQELLYIREDFINNPHHLPYRIVFGHTVFPQVWVEPDRLGIDTGAYKSGVLSAVALQGRTVRIFSATATQATVTSSKQSRQPQQSTPVPA